MKRNLIEEFLRRLVSPQDPWVEVSERMQNLVKACKHVKSRGGDVVVKKVGWQESTKAWACGNFQDTFYNTIRKRMRGIHWTSKAFISKSSPYYPSSQKTRNTWSTKPFHRGQNPKKEFSEVNSVSKNQTTSLLDTACKKINFRQRIFCANFNIYCCCSKNRKTIVCLLVLTQTFYPQIVVKRPFKLFICNCTTASFHLDTNMAWDVNLDRWSEMHLSDKMCTAQGLILFRQQQQ